MSAMMAIPLLLSVLALACIAIIMNHDPAPQLFLVGPMTRQLPTYCHGPYRRNPTLVEIVPYESQAEQREVCQLRSMYSCHLPPIRRNLRRRQSLLTAAAKDRHPTNSREHETVSFIRARACSHATDD
ncbi:hypothetical protein C8Q70DRAFT_49461 [Cubamyces menziesii]|nr:hypothetical protein C8Q70DRAFT_49461 [Cubamyces menziesii]